MNNRTVKTHLFSNELDIFGLEKNYSIVKDRKIIKIEFYWKI